MAERRISAKRRLHAGEAATRFRLDVDESPEGQNARRLMWITWVEVVLIRRACYSNYLVLPPGWTIEWSSLRRGVCPAWASWGCKPTGFDTIVTVFDTLRKRRLSEFTPNCVAAELNHRVAVAPSRSGSHPTVLASGVTITSHLGGLAHASPSCGQEGDTEPAASSSRARTQCGPQ